MVCNSILIEAQELINGCPEQVTPDRLGQLFGQVEIRHEEDGPYGGGYFMELNNGFFGIVNFYYYGSYMQDNLDGIVGYSTDGRTYQLTDIEDGWMNRYNGTLTLLDGGGVRLELNYTKLDDWARMTVTGTHEFTK